MASQPDMIDWAVAKRVGGFVAGAGPQTTPEVREQVRADFRAFTAQADELVRAFTGLTPEEGAPEPIVLDRNGWIRANLEGISTMIKPLTDKLEGSVRAFGPARRVAGAGIGAQVGVLLGYLSQKVLGQYDLVLASESGGRVYYVGPNVVEAERRHQLDPSDFRMWIALHEITHRTQFSGVPWLRDKMRSLIDRSIGAIDLDPARVRGLIERGKRLLLAGPSAWRSANVMELLMSPEQRVVVAEMQALMCVVEGHGTFVMNRIGREELESFHHMNEAINTRRSQAGNAERAFQRAIGMEMKYQQYKLGEQFMEAVAQRAGVAAVNKVWAGEDALPTMEEMHDPEAWLARIGA